MTESPANGQDIQVGIRWPDDVAAHPATINQFAILDSGLLLNGDPDQLLTLVFGWVAPPIITNQDDIARFQERGVLPVVERCAITITPARLADLSEFIQTQLATRGYVK